MTDLRKMPRNGLVVLVLVGAVLALVIWLRNAPTPALSEHVIDGYPELFPDVSDCPGRGAALQNGRRAEELGLLRADRYAYNPRDGVRAVARYKEALDCYRKLGASGDAARVRRSIVAMSATVNTDYAASRLNLANALEQERWPAALSEVHRLLLLTEHIRRHAYVEWLKSINGKITARAGASS